MKQAAGGIVIGFFLLVALCLVCGLLLFYPDIQKDRVNEMNGEVSGKEKISLTPMSEQKWTIQQPERSEEKAPSPSQEHMK